MTSKLAASRQKTRVSAVTFSHIMPLEGQRLCFGNKKPPTWHLCHTGDPHLFPHSTAPQTCHSPYYSHYTGNTDTKPAAAAAAQLAMESPGHHRSWVHSPKSGFLSPSLPNSITTMLGQQRDREGLQVLVRCCPCTENMVHSAAYKTLSHTLQSLMMKKSYEAKHLDTAAIYSADQSVMTMSELHTSPDQLWGYFYYPLLL